MNINTLNITHRPEELALEIWKISRPKDTDPLYKNIKTIDAPINDFYKITLEIECSILEREIFTSMNDAAIWAQTSRVNDPFKWRIPGHIIGYCDLSRLKELKTGMKYSMEGGDSQDKYRSYMPLAATTKFCFQSSVRSLYKIYKYFLYLSNYSAPFMDSAMAIKKVIPNFSQELCDSYGSISILHDVEDSVINQDFFAVGGYYFVGGIGTIALRAQVVRHNNLSLCDGLLDLIKNGTPWDMPIGTRIKMQISGRAKDWINIIKKRSCWMAQHDLWAGILNKFYRNMNISDDILPCDNSCPYQEDAELRMTYVDPGAPCPKYIKLKNYSINEDIIFDIRRQFTDERRPSFWNDIINSMGNNEND